jgi:TonB family protein
MRRIAGQFLCRVLGAGLLACIASVPTFAVQQPSTPGKAAQSHPSSAKPLIDADGTYHVGNGVTPPILVYSVDAEFSDAARRKKISATVAVGVRIGVDGLPKDVHVVRSAAEDFTKPKERKAAATLDEKAVEAARQYRFKPGMYQGKPVPTAVTVEVNFHIFGNK